MASRRWPVRPDLAQLEREVEELLEALQRGDPVALAESASARAASDSWSFDDARSVLARAYGLPGWARLAVACRLTDAIWHDDLDAVVELVAQDPALLHEPARGVRDNWGPPMSYAANVGRTRIVEALFARGARDLQHAFDRACLQGRLATARKLRALGARPERGAVMGPCESLNAEGLAFVLGLGAPVSDAHGDPLAPVALVLEGYARDPDGKHRCLELLAAHGVALPDTPAMAVHRGRIDLLERHLERDPRLFQRSFAHGEIWPRALGCHADESLALHGAPIAGGTLLHLCVDGDEIELARWILAHGGDADARAAVDADGFGGHSALYGCVVSQPYRCGRRSDGAFARLLLDHGADPAARASLRKRLRFVDDETLHEYRDVTAAELGARFHDQDWVDGAALRAIEERLPRG